MITHIPDPSIFSTRTSTSNISALCTSCQRGVSLTPTCARRQFGIGRQPASSCTQLQCEFQRDVSYVKGLPMDRPAHPFQTVNHQPMHPSPSTMHSVKPGVILRNQAGIYLHWALKGLATNGPPGRRRQCPSLSSSELRRCQQRCSPIRPRLSCRVLHAQQALPFRVVTSACLCDA